MKPIQRSEETRLCTFYVDGERYGIDILTVREVQRDPVVTPARGAHPSVRGLVNLRGQVVTVIDPAVRMGSRPREFGRQSRLVILKTNSELPPIEGGRLRTGEDRVGLCVDRVSDVHTVEPGSVGPLPPTLGRDAVGRDGLLTGIIQLPREVIRVMEPAAMLHLDEDA